MTMAENCVPQRIVLASGNPGKLAEFRELLAQLPYELLAQNALGIADPDETASTFVENALLKARHASLHSGLPAIADDSGLMVDALGGAPGLYSARYAGVAADSAANIAKLLQALASTPTEQRGAQFICVAVYLRDPLDPLPLIAQGIWRGRILQSASGRGGFGYDPIFAGSGDSLSAAELDPARKHACSHRGRAFAALKDGLQRNGAQ
jgi:XTP/dITP diphosphohydrolase